jgi:predicted Zn-ribbon and HTH transcriptional regulator
MRASLPHTLRERRRSRADGHKRKGAKGTSVAPAEPPAAAAADDVAATAASLTEAEAIDRAVARVRSAGGPLDEASYSCQCGFIFRAPVSTTVQCPHCHAAQAW